MISDYEEVVIRFKAYRISFVNFMKLMNAMELMNNFVNVIPDMNNRPSSFLKNVKTRQRASAKRKADTGFKWGEDE